MTTISVAMVIPELLERRAAEDPEGVALNVEAQRALRFGEWQERSLAVAHALLAAGVGRGSRVGLLFSGTDWIDYAVAYLGVLRAGAAGVHVNDKLSACEIDRRLAQAGASYLVYGAGGLPATLVRFTGPAVPLTALSAGGGTGPLPVSVGPEDIADV